MTTTTTSTPTIDQSTKFMLSENEKALLAEIVVDMESELLRVNSTHLASNIDGTSPGVGLSFGQTSGTGSGPSGSSEQLSGSGSGPSGPSGPDDFAVSDSELGSGLSGPGSGAYVDYEEYEYDEMYNPFELPQTDPLTPLSLTQLADQYSVEGNLVRGDEPRFARQSDLGEIIKTIDEKQRKARQFNSGADQQFNQVQFTAEQLEQQRQFAEQQQRFNLRQQQFGPQQQAQQQPQQFSLRAQQLFNAPSQQGGGGQFSALGSQPSGPITQRFQTPGFKNFPSQQTQTLLQQPQQNLLQQPQSQAQQPLLQQPQQTLLQSQNSLFNQPQFGQQPQSQFSSEQTFGSQQPAVVPQQQQFFQGQQQFQGVQQQQFGRNPQNFGQPQPAQAQQPQTPLPQQVKFVSFGREQDDQNLVLTSPSPIATSPGSASFQSFPARPTPAPAGPSATPQFESQRQNQGAAIRVRPVGSPNPSSQEAFPGFQGFNFDSPSRTTVPLQQSEQADFVTTRPPRPPNAKPPPNADPRQPGRFTSPRAPPSGSRFSVGNLMTRCLTIFLSSTSHSFLGSRKFPSQALQ